MKTPSTHPPQRVQGELDTEYWNKFHKIFLVKEKNPWNWCARQQITSADCLRGISFSYVWPYSFELLRMDIVCMYVLPNLIYHVMQIQKIVFSKQCVNDFMRCLLTRICWINNSFWFISRLTIGTNVQMSATIRKQQITEIQHTDIHSYIHTYIYRMYGIVYKWMCTHL